MIKAKDIMTKDMITVPVGTTLAKAYELMGQNRIRHLPVLDDEENMVGILSQRDFPAVFDWNSLKVEHLMNPSIEHILVSTPLKAAILLMLSKKISSLVVLDESDYAVGIITTDDVLSHFALQMKDERSPVSEFLAGSAETVGRVLHTIAQAGI